MFSLHESTQRLVCRILFIFCAAVPAVGTLLFIVYSLRPWAEDDWRQSLSQQLHVHVEVEKVCTLRPGVQELTGIRIADLRTQEPLAEIDKVFLSWHGGKLLLEVDQLEVKQSRMNALASALSTTLTASDLPPARIEADRVFVLGNGQQQLEFAEVGMQCASTDSNQRILRIECEPRGAYKETHLPLVHLDIKRHGSVTTAILDTGGCDLPAWLLSDLWPGLAACTEATFAGRIVLRGEPTRSEGSLYGRIDNIDFAKWLGESSPHTLDGVGQLELHELRWRDRRIEEMHGSLQASQGSVSHSLLKELQEQLYCKVAPAIAPEAEAEMSKRVPYDELSCAFHLAASGLTLRGRCQSLRDRAPGCVLASKNDAVLWETSHTMPVGQLVRVFSFPAGDLAGWLPASREAADMAGSLPLPRVGPQPQPVKQEVAAQPKDSTSR